MSTWVDVRRWTDSSQTYNRVNYAMADTAVRILLVEEDRAEYCVVAHLAASISNRPHLVSWCDQPAEALPSILSNQYDIILLEGQRSPTRVRELLRAAVAGNCSAPIIVIGDTLDETLDHCAIADGATDYILKPNLNPSSFERVLRYALKRKDQERQIAARVQYDILTGFPNRLLFRDRLEQAIAHAHREHSQLALLHIDLDGFRRVNESFGNNHGDELIQQAAERLQACVRKTDGIARIGSDE